MVSARGVKKALKPLTEPVKRILTDVIYLDPINITCYRKGSRIFRKSQGGKKAQNNVGIDYLKFYSALLKI